MKKYDAEKAAAMIGIEMDSMWMLLAMFDDSLDESITEIGQAVKDMDMKNIHDYGHKLKGASANLGFNDLAEYCRILEHGAKENENINYADAFSNLKNEADAIKTWYSQVEK